MNLEGFTPHPVTRFSSLLEQDDPTNIPIGVSPLARNVRYHLTGCRTRDGIQQTVGSCKVGFTTPRGNQPVTGLYGLKQGAVAGAQVPIVFDFGGGFWAETPAGSGTLEPISVSQLTPPASSYLQATPAYNRGYLAFTDLKNSTASPAVYDIPTGNLDPISLPPFGSNWTANTAYVAGDVVTPATPAIVGNGHSYRSTAAGTSGGTQPNFPTADGATVADGTVTWTEFTPVLAQSLQTLITSAPAVTHNAGVGSFASGRDVYIAVTLVNGNGESLLGGIFVFINTAANDQFVVTSPVLRLWAQQLTGANAVTGYNVYEADVPTGNAAPVTSAFKKVNGSLVSIGTITSVNTSGNGAAPPTSDNSFVAPVGNICTGLRYMVVLFVNRNGYISGMSEASVISFTSAVSGRQLYVARIPTGPSNTAQRICAFSPAGTQGLTSGISTAGPFFYIATEDVVSGVTMTATVIADNTTTTATFNFTDAYLVATENEVSAYFRKIQIPGCSDVYFAKSMGRMIYKPDSLPSGFYVSLPDDPESVYGDTGLVQVAENNGEKAICWREFRSQQYAFKERSGHIVSPSPSDPSTWQVQERWFGAGPCGPRAVDVATNFLCFAHRSGVWVYFGDEPLWISKEIPITWSKIHWAFQHLIWVMIDEETREIRIGVPYGTSTVPSLVLKCNYEESPTFAPPIHFSPYIGKEIATGACYKWSVDTIAAAQATRMERTLVNPPDGLDLATEQSQILYASSNPDGIVAAVVPGTHNDMGTGIDSVYETASSDELMRPNQLGGVQANIGGAGTIDVTVLALRTISAADGGVNAFGTEIRLKKQCIAGVPYTSGASGQNERFRMRFSNGKRPDSWFDLKFAAIFAKPIATGRPGDE